VHLLGFGIGIELRKKAVAILGCPISQMVDIPLDQLPASFAELICPTKVRGVPFNQTRIEAMLAD
jgi:hypothetical protein